MPNLRGAGGSGRDAHKSPPSPIPCGQQPPSPARPGLGHRPPAPGAPRPRARLSTEHFSPRSFFSRSFPALPARGCGLHLGVQWGRAGSSRPPGLCSLRGPRGHPRKGCLEKRALGSAGPSRVQFFQIQAPRMKRGKKEEESPLRTCK